MKIIIRLIIISAFIFLAGCLSPAKVTPMCKYLINMVPQCVPVKQKRSIILLISLPETRPVYDTTKMAYTVKPYQVSYFALNQWGDVPSEMFQPLLVQTMQNTHHFKAVVIPPYNGIYDYELDTEIISLIQDYTCPVPQFLMTVRAQIIKTSSNRVIGSRQFVMVEPLRQRSPYGGVFAANLASVRILEEIAAFCLETIR